MTIHWSSAGQAAKIVATLEASDAFGEGLKFLMDVGKFQSDSQDPLGIGGERQCGVYQAPIVRPPRQAESIEAKLHLLDAGSGCLRSGIGFREFESAKLEIMLARLPILGIRGTDTPVAADADCLRTMSAPTV